MKKREEIEVKYTWNMEDMLASDEVFEQLYKETEEKISGYELFENHLADSPDVLFSCLQFDEEMSRKTELLYVYGKQKSDENTGNNRYQDYAARALALSYRVGELSAYMVPEILSMDPERLQSFQRSDERLAHFNRALEMILEKKEHTLSASMEELLAKSFEATQSPSQIYNMFNNADLRFPSVKDWDGNERQITHGNFTKFLECSDRSVRKAAFEAVYHTYGQFKNTLAATFFANVKQAVFYARAKRYKSSLEHSLGENEIPSKVYENLMEAVHEGLPYLHRYVKLRADAMNLSQIHMYDLYVPLVESAESSYPFERACEMVLEGLKPLGSQYGELLREGFLNRWIDVYESEGKRSGAYSWGAYGVHPYVLLNYNGSMDHIFTLAHEMGHALHSYYSDQNQSFTYAGYKIFVAEVASTCNEALLIRDLLEKSKDVRERCYLINHFLKSFYTTLYRQAMFAEFEMEAHKMAEEGQPLTADLLCTLYHSLNEKYFGPDMTVDSEIDCEWSRIPHFYTPFYVYQYATGFSAAVAISSRILAGDEKAIEGYFSFLSGGCSMKPIELLKLCGIDMMTPEPVREALLVFRDLLDQFETLHRDMQG